MICGNCGVANDEGTRFCSACGMYLSAKAAKPTTPPPPPVEATPVVPEQVAPAVTATEPAGSGRNLPMPEVDAAPAALDAAVAHVVQGQHLATEHNRPDLASHLEATRTALTRQTYSVAVIGEFKQGKSTLVNALLHKDVCPVDADLVTAVPTLVTYGEQPYAKAYYASLDEEGAETVRPIPLARLSDFVSEVGDPQPRQDLRMVEVGLPHRLLRSGMCLVDTPGVGGLESAQGVLTLSTLSTVQGALFVTDASQELTEPEVEFLKQAVERCPSVTVVVTKTDLYQEWRRIVDIDAQHLADAGLDIGIIAVSSFLRLRAMRDPALSEESGFRVLVQHLASAVIGGATQAAAEVAGSEVRFVAKELSRQVEAERSVIDRPERAAEVVAELTDTKARTAQLAAPGASWQQVLADGIQDLTADVEHDLHRRLRLVVRDIEAVIDESDPQSTWSDTEIWLRRQVAVVAVDNRDLLAARTAELVDSVARHFDLDASEITLRSSSPAEALDRLVLPSAASLKSPTGRLGPSVMAARFSVLIPTTIVEVASGILGTSLLLSGPIGLVLGAGVGYKLVKGESNRQVAYRRQQGKIASRRYVDEVTFLLNKDCRDTLRGTQRMLRDEFQQRALALHRSSTAALASVEAAKGMDRGDRAARAVELTRQSREVQRLGAELVGAGVAPGARGV